MKKTIIQILKTINAWILQKSIAFLNSVEH